MNILFTVTMLQRTNTFFNKMAAERPISSIIQVFDMAIDAMSDNAGSESAFLPLPQKVTELLRKQEAQEEINWLRKEIITPLEIFVRKESPKDAQYLSPCAERQISDEVWSALYWKSNRKIHGAIREKYSDLASEEFCDLMAALTNLVLTVILYALTKVEKRI